MDIENMNDAIEDYNNMITPNMFESFNGKYLNIGRLIILMKLNGKSSLTS